MRTTLKVDRSQPTNGYDNLPKTYLRKSNILRETQETIDILNLLVEIAAETGVTQHGEMMAPHLSSSQRDRILASPSVWVPHIGLANPLLREACERLDHEVKRLDKVIVYRNETAIIPFITVVRGVSPILRGYLEHIDTELIVPEERAPILAMLLKIVGWDDTLDRENSQWGYHYHYCNKYGSRSDTVLTFNPNKSVKKDPLYWERHGEGHAKFKANVPKWGNKKRESVYDAAFPGLTKPGRTAFRSPSKEAEILWPES